MKRGRGAAALLVLATVVLGCSQWLRRPAPEEPDRRAADALADADREALAGRAREASARYEAIVREHATDPAAAEALHRLAMQRLDPKSPLRDRRAGQAMMRRLATEYPDTLAGREARVWRGLVRELDRCTLEATRRGADAEKLRQTLESIRDSDLELEQQP